MGAKKFSAKQLLKDYSPDSAVDKAYMELVAIFPLIRIESEKQNERALEILDRLATYLNGTARPAKGVSQYVGTLSNLVAEFESRQFESKLISGREMLSYLLEIHHLKQSDLELEVGGQSVVSDLLKGKRDFNTKQIKALCLRFKVEPALFMR
jgi:HTH-type transcriptional regulator/antitoxin HigA